METSTEVLMSAEEKMDKCVEFLQQELSGLRTGKASPSLVENITVEYYGTATRLRDISNISTPEPRLIVISPFDPSSLGAIEKGISAANIGITPMNDGRLIRVPIPELSEERRKDLVKVAGRTTEEQRVAVRNVRREANEQLKALQKNSKITEDERDESLEEVQKLTDSHIKKMDELLAAKEKEVLVV
jgi:ribosome recycling factor